MREAWVEESMLGLVAMWEPASDSSYHSDGVGGGVTEAVLNALARDYGSHEPTTDGGEGCCGW